jgi:hypothetical protein
VADIPHCKGFVCHTADSAIRVYYADLIGFQLTQRPTFDQEKAMLDLKGCFRGQPVQINFELLYQAVNGQWRLFGISV